MHDPRRGLCDSALLNPLFLTGTQTAAPGRTAAITDDTFNQREDEMEELEQGGETEVDDDPARDRAVRVVGLTPEENHELSDKAWARRRWEVVPLRTTATRNAGSL